MTTAPEPKFGDLVKINGEGWDGIPDSPMPYYLGARDGLFIHRRLLFGRGVARISNWPDNFKNVGNSTGRFQFDADPIPGKLMAQIVSFFQRIYHLQKSEANVLLTMHTETKEWGVFIPTQLVSHGGVNYVYDPQHIQHGRIVVGSIHSHADFSPFHSGTDTGDAADFDGLHGTIGFVNQTPKIVMMVSLNKQNMHYAEADFPSIFDWTELGQHTAPEWWDQYVGTSANNQKPIGHELYAKFARPTEVKTHGVVGNTHQRPPNGLVVHQGGYNREQQASRQMQSDWGIPAQTKRTTPTRWWEGQSPADLIRRGYVWDVEKQTFIWGGTKPTIPMTDPSATAESARFNMKKAAERGEIDWDSDYGALSVKKLSASEAQELRSMLWRDSKDEDEDGLFWEDSIPDAVMLAMMESECLTDEDIDYAVGHPKECGNLDYWKKEFVAKALGAIHALRAMNIDASLKLTTEATPEMPEQEWLLPEPTIKTENTEVTTHAVH